MLYGIGHSVNIQNNSGDTPLHKACEHGHSNIVETLMLVGADETISNDDGETPAQVAACMEHGKLLQLLTRDSLWLGFLKRRMFRPFSVGFLMVLKLRLVRQKIMTKLLHTWLSEYI